MFATQNENLIAFIIPTFNKLMICLERSLKKSFFHHIIIFLFQIYAYTFIFLYMMSEKTMLFTLSSQHSISHHSTHKDKPETKPAPSQSDQFRQRALSFLTNITTGSSKSSEKKNVLPEPLNLIPCSSTFALSRVRNQEEDDEICKVQAWVTSGVIKKSYSHCLSIHSFNFPNGRVFINIDEYPGRIMSGSGKEKLNNEFSALHPYLESKLTLSKLSNLREDIIFQVWKVCEFDLVTLAVGFTLFDRLLAMNLVNKINRKLYAAVCVLLSFKFIEETHLDEIYKKQSELLTQLYRMDKRDLLTPQTILESEFSVYAYLNFSIHLEYQEFKYNLEYIKKRLNI